MTSRAQRNRSAIDPATSGIAGLPSTQVFVAKQHAKKIFNMVTEGRGTTEQLRALVRHESLLELIYVCIDLSKSARATVAATAKRKQHPIVALIEKIVRDRPKISAKELERELDRLVGDSEIYGATDTAFEVADTKFRAIGRSGLKDHLTRAKKKIAIAS